MFISNMNCAELMHLSIWSTHPTALLAKIFMLLLFIKEKLLEFYRGSTGSHSGDNWRWKTQWTNRSTVYTIT